MPSLQEAIYVISPRFVDLFRKADIDDSDFRRCLMGADCLHRQHPAGAVKFLKRIDSANLNCDIESDERRAARIEDFLRLFEPDGGRGLLGTWKTVRQARRERATLLPYAGRAAISGTSCVRTSSAGQAAPTRRAPPRPLLSHAIAGGHPNVAACLLALCGPLDPYLDVVPVLSRIPTPRRRHRSTCSPSSTSGREYEYAGPASAPALDRDERMLIERVLGSSEGAHDRDFASFRWPVGLARLPRLHRGGFSSRRGARATGWRYLQHFGRFAGDPSTGGGERPRPVGVGAAASISLRSQPDRRSSRLPALRSGAD